jgi:hypothetical protein
MTMKARTTALLLLILVPTLAGCAGTMGAGSLQPSATTTTAIQGWERYLQIEMAQAQPGGRVEGYVSSHYGTMLINVQLLAQALDANGNVLGQKVEWLGNSVPPLQRVYFRIPGLPAAAQYRVSVWAFDSAETQSWM